MPQAFLDILGEFGAGYGDPSNLVVRFLLAAFFWSALLFLARQQWRERNEERDRWVAAAAAAGLTRELFMFVMEYGAKRGYLPHDVTHSFYPPLEHALTQTAYLLNGAAFTAYFAGRRPWLRYYVGAAGAAIVVLFAVVQWTWPPFLRANPDLPFGAYPLDVWIHAMMAGLLAPFLVSLVRERGRGAPVPWPLVAGFGFFLLDDILMVLHLSFDRMHPEIFAPVRHNLHIWAIPWFIAVYWGEQRRREVAERKRTEAVIAAMGDGVCIHDRELRVTYQNRRHREMLGEQEGELCYRACHGNEVPCRNCPVLRAMTEGGVHVEERFHPETGRYFSITASPLHDAFGKTVAGIEVVRDITEQRLMEQRAAESQKMEAVGQLAGGVAHDFNNLLTVILGRCDILLMNPEKSGAARRELQEIHKVGERAAALTRQLLAFSRKQNLHPRVVEFNRVVTGMGPMLKRLIPESIEVRMDLQEGAGRVFADPHQMEQVILNLAINARDAMPDGGTLLLSTCSVHVEEDRQSRYGPLKAGHYLVLSVQDSGTGIPQDALGRLFEPFFTTKGAGHGTGLGLATVYGIIRQSLGALEVDSESDAGSVFRVYLPRVGAPEEARHHDPSQDDEPALVTGSETVLLVEDEESVRELVHSVLSSHGYHVLAAEDGADAQGLLEKHDGPVDVLLADVVLPGISGPELVRRLDGRTAEMQVLFMSGYTDEELSRHGFDEREVELLEKPFAPQELLRRLRGLLDDRRATGRPSRPPFTPGR